MNTIKKTGKIYKYW